MMRLFGVLMTAAAIALVGIAATSRTAHACSCGDLELSAYADDITVAFVGRQLERVVHDQVDDNGTALLFRVDRVYKGEAGPLIEVRTHAQESACGIDLGGMGAVGVAARTWRGDLSVDLCNSMVTAAELPRRLRRGPSARRLDPPPGLGRRSEPARVPAHRRCRRGSRGRRSRMAPTTVQLLARRSKQQRAQGDAALRGTTASWRVEVVDDSGRVERVGREEGAEDRWGRRKNVAIAQ